MSRNGVGLVAELEFVWNQIKSNTTSESSPDSSPRRFQQPTSGSEGPMRVLSPMSEQDEAELRSQRQIDLEEEEVFEEDIALKTSFQRKVERAITKLAAEVAALREQITTGREWRSKKDRTAGAWFGYLLWNVLRHVVIDSFLLLLILLWMRRRKDRRLEDLFRASLTLAREYVRKVLPAR